VMRLKEMGVARGRADVSRPDNKAGQGAADRRSVGEDYEGRSTARSEREDQLADAGGVVP